MTKYLLAVAVVALGVSVGAADDKPVVVTGTPVTVAAPVMVSSVPTVVESMPAQTARRGLFGRRSGRNATTTMTTVPTVTTTATPVTTITTTSALTMPVPTPVATTGTTTGTTTVTMTTPEAPSGIIVVGGATATEGTIVPAAYAEPTNTTNTTRRGLFGRLRNR